MNIANSAQGQVGPLGPGGKNVFTFARGQHALKGPEPERERKGLAPVVQTVQNMRTAFLGALKQAGIRDFRFHDLRHTFASHLIMRGASLKEVEELLGHKNISMTMRYAHLSQESIEKAVNLLAGLTTQRAKSVPVTKVSQSRKSVLFHSLRA